ncbi:hypothetical protein M409DRAFT_48994 [Zasmidium cellare ATCC 36951]|uniref:Uncharacterized protein n=1 Tax=Zasmidium cellare ATCC 36951 TaxID=1080233 RepID=A0A6A6D745_ZASCE|nr:uncharacterized protein M409DRAFT_48994 [Zasmidium cellare ATCC 36951]KAF2174120.1 hypothetical protein M409DRAFT_48994 [Zasmidium cellare ATCC 36951]
MVTSAVLSGSFVYQQVRKGDTASVSFHILKRCTGFAGCLFASSKIAKAAMADTTSSLSTNLFPAAVLSEVAILVATFVGDGVGSGMSASGYYAPFMIFASAAMTIAVDFLVPAHSLEAPHELRASDAGTECVSQAQPLDPAA